MSSDARGVTPTAWYRQSWVAPAYIALRVAMFGAGLALVFFGGPPA